MDTRQAQGLPDEDEPRLDGFEFWYGEFSRLGLTSPQAEVLADSHGVDRHAVREALVAARARGTDADWVFAAFS